MGANLEKDSQFVPSVSLSLEQWGRVATAILITLREGNSESTVEWDFNSQFDDIRKLERETFLSDLKCRLAHPELQLY